MRYSLLFALAFTIPIAVPAAETFPGPQGETARINYSLGYQIGGDFKRQGVEMDADAVVQGIRDALAGAEPRMAEEEMKATLIELKRRIVTRQKNNRLIAASKAATEDKRFLEENRKKPGVVTLENGLQYRIVAAGNDRHPAATDQVTVNYRGTLTGGQEFDSSYARGKPATFRLGDVIKGWTEGLQLIGEGGRIELFIPSVLGYGNAGPLANRALVFEVELLAVAPPEQAAAE